MDEEEIAELFLSWKLEVLKELREYIVKNLEPHKLFTYLRCCDILDESDEEEIKALTTRKRRNEYLIDLIGKRGSEGFDEFCEAIRRNTTQLFILRTILNCFQKKREANNTLTEQTDSSQAQRSQELLLPIPGDPGGPPIPHFENPEENTTAVNGFSRQERSRSPPPPYSETSPY